MKFDLRAMQAQDAAAVASLAAELGYPVAVPSVQARFAHIAGLAGHALWVAEQAGEVVAWTHGQITELLISAPFVEITALVVAGTARRQGAGRLLLAALAQWAQAQGVNELRVRARDSRTAAHRFYCAEGFAELKVQRVFQRVLGGGMA